MRFLLHHWPVWVVFLVGQFGFDFGDLTDVLLGYLSDIVSFLLAAIQYIWSVLVFVANYIWAALNWIWNLAYSLFQNIKDALKWVWENVIKAGLTKLISLIQRIRQWLHDTLGPVIDFIKKVRRWYDDFFNRYVRPLLVILQRIRQFLAIFRLLGFKWAIRLDGDIAAIENKVAQIYTTLRGYLNQAITWLDLIVDPTGILRRNPLFGALFSNAAELRNIVLTAPYRPLTGGETDSQTRDRSQASIATQKQNFTDYYSQGKVTPDDDTFISQFNAEIDALLNGQGEPSV